MATRQAVASKPATQQPTTATSNGRGLKPAAKRPPRDMSLDGLEQTSIDLEQDVRQQVVTVLNQQLADTFDLFSQTKQAHWNVKGRDFYQLHLLFDTLAEGLENHIDEIAERVTALGGEAKGTVRLAASSTRLPEYLPGAASGMTHVQELVERYANLAASTRAASERCEELEDMSTSDLFNDVSRDLDKWLWFLEAHLQSAENTNQ